MEELSKFAEEIMVEILSELPPKSLMRFKNVRRSWNALINNPKFVAKHLTSSKRTKLLSSSSSTSILFRRFLKTDLNTNETEMVLSLFNFCDDFDGWFLDQDIHFPHFLGIRCRGNFIQVDIRFHIVCHCDGIICLAGYGPQKPIVVLCNPATKEFNLLPESQLALSSPHLCTTAAVGFGYDLRLRNYKVVRLIDDGLDCGRINHRLKAEVYDLLTYSWKEIKSDSLVKENTIFLDNAPTKGIYFKGIIYWCAREDDDRCYNTDDFPIIHPDMNAQIISFDLGDDTFHVTNMGRYIDCYLVQAVLGFWKESIAFFVRSDCNYNIWVMDNSGGGKGGSWIKYLELEPVVTITS